MEPIFKIDTWEFIKMMLWTMWFVIKIMWPFLLFVFLIKIFEVWADRKIDNWKGRRRR